MLKSEHFVTISLDTNECEICHQCTSEAIVTCKQCFQPVTEEPVREGFNKLLGVVHQNHLGHEACFKKAHQVLSQSLTNTGHRKLSSDSVTSQLKGLLDEKLQKIMKYARNEGNLSVPQPLLEVKSTPCSRTSSPLRDMSNTRFEQATKRKCNSDENIAVRQSRRPAHEVPTTYDREQCESVILKPGYNIHQVRTELVKHAPTDQNVHIQDDRETNYLDSHDPKSEGKAHCQCHHRECRDGTEMSKLASSRQTIKIPSDRYVYLPCEHQYASEGWTVDDLICDVCEHHQHQMNQSEQFLTSRSQSESSTDSDVDADSDLLPVAKFVATCSNKDIKEAASLMGDFKIYSSEELTICNGEQLSKILGTLKTMCTDISSKLVLLLQERDDLKQEVKVRHLMIAKLVSIQSTE